MRSRRLLVFIISLTAIFAGCRLLDKSPPDNPSELSATAGATAIDLIWTDNSSVETDYVIERKEEGGIYSTLVDNLPANTEAHSDDAVSEGITYYYQVRATNSFGFSAPSNEVSCSITGNVQIIITVNNPEDETITFTQPEDLVVGPTDTLTVSVNETFDSYEWLLDGIVIGSIATVNIDCSLEEPGVHHLAVFVEKNGSTYSNTLRFSIEN